MTRPTEINRHLSRMVYGQVVEELEPILVARHLTQEQVDRYRKTVGDFLWPTDSTRVEEMDPLFGERRFKVSIVQEPWREPYPLDQDASVVFYKPESQLRILMTPNLFLWWATNFRFSPEQFKAQALEFSATSLSLITERILERKPLDPPFLDLNWSVPSPALADIVSPRWEVDGHEGRHRAVASDDAGIQQMPVILFVRVQRDIAALWELDDEQVRKLHEFAGRFKS